MCCFFVVVIFYDVLWVVFCCMEGVVFDCGVVGLFFFDDVVGGIVM